MDQLEIIAAHDEGMLFDHAYVVEENGIPRARAIVGGVVCNIETRTGPLADGLAFCQPNDIEAGLNWPMYIDLQRESASAPERWWNMTVNPRIVAAARRFRELLARGEAKAGVEL